jgi:DNA-binding transcriptional LysR family regulator
MDLRQLRYFVAIYENRSLSRAAQACNVAQSALSLHMSNLETDLGSPLFIRLPRGMAPTAAGVLLYEPARAILRSIHAAEEDLRQASGRIAGDIAIGMAYSAVKAIGVRFPAVGLILPSMEHRLIIRLSRVQQEPHIIVCWLQIYRMVVMTRSRMC